MNQASFFIEKKALFGGYPNHNQLLELKEEGVVWFVDLTCSDEKNIKTYCHLVNNWINYPIKDKHIPQDKKKFTIFLFIIQMILDSLKPGEKLYLHCRGGHGRSSLVIACFLTLLLNISPDESLYLVKEYHALRPNLSLKWLTKAPFNLKQQKFVKDFFGLLYLYSNFQNSVACTADDYVVAAPIPALAGIGIIDGPSSAIMTPIPALAGIGTADEMYLCKRNKFKFMVILNFYLHQHPTILDVLLNSGLKNIQGEGITSIMLQELRAYILYFHAKKIFDLT